MVYRENPRYTEGIHDLLCNLMKQISLQQSYEELIRKMHQDESWSHYVTMPMTSTNKNQLIEDTN